MAPHLVQHRFRKASDAWPLIQIGPGVLTVNDTCSYRWEDFRVRVTNAIATLYAAYPPQHELVPTHLALRYVDAVEFDYTSNSVLDFLQENLKVSIALPTNLFDGTQVKELPINVQSQMTYRCQAPRGLIHLKLATGQRSNNPAVIWETTVEAGGPDIPPMPSAFENWIDNGHKLVNDWFFKMIDGKLHEEFKGE